MQLPVSITDRHHAIVRTVLVLAYVAGIIGLQLPGLAHYFRPLSPLTLISSCVVLLVYHTDWRPSFYTYMLLAVLTGYFVEVLGVHTGLIFGHYAYQWGLGACLWGVPPVIGINWLTLSYCCGSIFDQLPAPVYAKSVGAATLMVLLDICIEPVAVQLNFWTWFGQPVPWQNYAGWWVVSFILFNIWYALPFRKENRLAKWLLALQFLFFLGHNLFRFWQ